MQSFRTLTPSAIAAATALMVLYVPLAQAQDVELSMSSTAGADGRITASGTGGRYDRVDTSSLTVALRLQASIKPEDGKRRFVSSELELAPLGAARGELAAVTGEGRPATSLDIAREFTLGLAADGAAARSAIEACNAISTVAAPTTIEVPVVWRVTTGRFNFRWTDYDYLAPTDDIVSDPDYYADRQTSERELKIAVALECKPLGAPRVAKQAAPKSDVKAAARPARTLATAPVQAAKPKSDSTAPIATASIEASVPPKCDGGMVRELGEGRDAYLCLCPGNTVRVATGDNAFACERRARRR